MSPDLRSMRLTFADACSQRTAVELIVEVNLPRYLLLNFLEWNHSFVEENCTPFIGIAAFSLVDFPRDICPITLL